MWANQPNMWDFNIEKIREQIANRFQVEHWQFQAMNPFKKKK